MKLELAIVESCGPQGCTVKMLSDNRRLDARYSALVLNRVRILPGQMVAVDLSPSEPEVAWRWYRVTLLEAGPGGYLAAERERQLTAAAVPGLERTLTAGDEAWLTGMDGGWEIHDLALGDAPAHLNRLVEQILPRIAQALSAAPAQ